MKTIPHYNPPGRGALRSVVQLGSELRSPVCFERTRPMTSEQLTRRLTAACIVAMAVVALGILIHCS